MWVFTEIAEWFDKRRALSDDVLDQMVEDAHYGQGAILVASTVKALTTFGAGFVDILKLGDGVTSGTLKGGVQDALRVVAIFPLGKAATMLRQAKGAAAAKLVIDTGGPNCFWVASAKAFRQIGHKFDGELLASVDDVAGALGMSMENLWRIPNLGTGLSYLQRIGAKIGPVAKVTSEAEVARLVPRDGSVVMVVVKLIKNGRESGRHAVYAFRDSLGSIRYMDRTIRNATQEIYTSLNEFGPFKYGATLVPEECAVLYNVFAKSIGLEAPRLVIPVLGVIATDEGK